MIIGPSKDWGVESIGFLALKNACLSDSDEKKITEYIEFLVWKRRRKMRTKVAAAPGAEVAAALVDTGEPKSP